MPIHPVRQRLFAAVLLITVCGFSGRPATGTLRITLVPLVDGKPLILENRLYHIQNGDSLYVDMLRFYLSTLRLKGKNGVVFSEKDSYHLIDAGEDGNCLIALENIPIGVYDTFFFNVGTDSLTNVSGAMGGDLDPTRGMYWAWNTGYVNVKIEGRSNTCNTLHHAFTFHLGGYMPPHQTVRKVELPLQNLRIGENATTDLRIAADLGRFFSRLQLAQTNSVMLPSKQAAQLADYFSGIFSPE